MLVCNQVERRRYLCQRIMEGRVTRAFLVSSRALMPGYSRSQVYFVDGEIIACLRDVPEPIGTSAKSYSVLNVSYHIADVLMATIYADLARAPRDTHRLTYNSIVLLVLKILQLL
jgi:hypothetical protein